MGSVEPPLAMATSQGAGEAGPEAGTARESTEGP